jgi:hypothetical protein
MLRTACNGSAWQQGHQEELEPAAAAAGLTAQCNAGLHWGGLHRVNFCRILELSVPRIGNDEGGAAERECSACSGKVIGESHRSQL